MRIFQKILSVIINVINYIQTDQIIGGVLKKRLEYYFFVGGVPMYKKDCLELLVINVVGRGGGLTSNKH